MCFSELRQKWTEENGKEGMLILLSMKLTDSLNPKRVELYQANQYNKPKGKRAGQVKN